MLGATTIPPPHLCSRPPVPRLGDPSNPHSVYNGGGVVSHRSQPNPRTDASVSLRFTSSSVYLYYTKMCQETKEFLVRTYQGTILNLTPDMLACLRLLNPVGFEKHTRTVLKPTNAIIQGQTTHDKKRLGMKKTV